LSTRNCIQGIAFFLVAGCLLQSCERQENFPNRPITFICPWSAGGGTDRVSRQLAFLLEQDLGVPVNVVNATGGGGVTGHTRGSMARPDGYTLTMVTVELNMLHWRGLTNITYEDYEPVMMVNFDPTALFVRTDSEWQTLAQLQQSIRQHPGKLKASGTAFGGIWHVGLAGYLNKAGLNPGDVTWIAMGGSAPSLQELMASGLDIVACSLSEAQVLLKSDKVRALCVMSEKRLAAFPDVATLHEMGIDWQIGAYRGIAVPVGVPAERFAIIELAVTRAVHSKAYADFLSSTGAGYAALPSDAFKKYLAQTEKNFGEIMTGEAFAGVKRKYSVMFFPGLLAAMFIVCLSALTISGGLRRRHDTVPLTATSFVDIAVIVFGILMYVVAAETIGFISMAIVMLFVFFWRQRVRPGLYLPVTLLLVPLLYQLFVVYLRVPLPRGWIGW
jgi:tripartite-type tricarboxylate transporter receptor subunit TctC